MCVCVLCSRAGCAQVHERARPTGGEEGPAGQVCGGPPPPPSAPGAGTGEAQLKGVSRSRVAIREMT